MSIGIGGKAKMVYEDVEKVVYAYAPYNLNDEEYRNALEEYDGVITIKKSALVEADVHKKLKKYPTGRKQLIVKRVHREVDYSSRFASGEICVKNSKYCWSFCGDNNIGRVASSLIWLIFNKYQDDALLPQDVLYNV